MDAVSYALSRKYHDKPVASYTHTSNVEIAVSAFDVDTDTFTAVGHGLINGDMLYPVPNYTCELAYPVIAYPTGMTRKTYPGYYVVEKGDDTFKLSLTSGGAAINFAANASLDLTQWHFEKNLSTGSITILNLPTLSKARIVVYGKWMCGSNYIYPTGTSQEQKWVKNSETTLAYDNLSVWGDIHAYLEVIIDYTKLLLKAARGFSALSNTVSANIPNTVNYWMVNPLRRNGTFTSLVFYNWMMCNGTVIEVYKV